MEKFGLMVSTAVLMSLPSYLASIAGVSIGLTNPSTYGYALVFAPVVEETFRNLAARWTGLWNAGVPVALGVGTMIGILEIFFKAVSSNDFSFGGLVETSSSISIHAGLSVAFYALQQWRLPIMIGLHALINGSIVYVANLVYGTMTEPAFVATLLITTTIVSALSAAIANLWRRDDG
jgi:hypothetical protein